MSAAHEQAVERPQAQDTHRAETTADPVGGTDMRAMKEDSA
ncbi:hypothetical protein ACFC09_29410 [Streptomyces sp. NPDC056161]